ncbi:MAG: DUF2914 domain-containing protein [Myxococcota bacterium]
MKPVRFLLLGCVIALSGAALASADDEASWAADSVARATFTSGVADREPVDTVTEVTTDHSVIYFFSELQNMAGERVTHRWEYNGQVMAEVPFSVGGPRWRVWSSKNLEPFWVGEWTVSVMKDGAMLESRSFRYAESVIAPASPQD